LFFVKGDVMESSIKEMAQETSMIKAVPVGAFFEHYSGKKYKILSVGRHSETLELCVVYQGLYDCPTFGPNPIWIRPLKMFLESVMINAVEQPRFRRLEEG
jgi:hypothetical protein